MKDPLDTLTKLSKKMRDGHMLNRHERRQIRKCAAITGYGPKDWRLLGHQGGFRTRRGQGVLRRGQRK